MAPPLGRQDCKIAKKSEQNWGIAPPFASWASGFGLEIWLILGEKWDEIWVWQFQILIYVPLKFSEVSGPLSFQNPAYATE